MIGKTLAHYEITGLLGKGGMGEVYRARDRKLGREVALKFLPSDFAQDHNRLRRFEREARLLASLNHPNIATIHGLEIVDGHHFLVLEFVDGEDLQARLSRGPVPIPEAVQIARQIAVGLESAHAKGIVHRDLKPANIKISADGLVKILDFGLARAYAGEVLDVDDPATAKTLNASLTVEGTILGTAAYMSPEQARGGRVDQRSDIWAFGVVLYEMLVGFRPFSGKTVSDTIAAVLRTKPDLDLLPKETPASVYRMLERCLQKDPSNRLQAIGEARIEFTESVGEPEVRLARTPGRRGILPVAAAVTIALALLVGWMVRTQKSGDPQIAGPSVLAVVDFRDLSSPDDLTFSVGISELVHVGLVETSGCRVVSSERLYDVRRRLFGRGRGLITSGEALEVARECGATIMLTGQRIGGGANLVTCQLIDVETGNTIHAGRVDGTTLVGIADGVITSVIPALRGKCDPPDGGEYRTVGKLASELPEAYRHYVLGLVALENRDPRTLTHLQRAVELDTTFALAYLSLAQAAYSSNSPVGFDRDLAEKSIDAAWRHRENLSSSDLMHLGARRAQVRGNHEDAARKYELILERWPDDKHALLSLARLRYFDSDQVEAGRVATRGLALYPDEPEFASIYAQGCLAAGKFEEGLHWFKVVTKLRPDQANDWDNLALHFLAMGNPDSAEVAIQRAIIVDPKFLWSGVTLALCEYQRGNVDQAIKKIRPMLDIKATFGQNVQIIEKLSAFYAEAGRFDDGLRICDLYDGTDITAFQRGQLNQIRTLRLVEAGLAREAYELSLTLDSVFTINTHRLRSLSATDSLDELEQEISRQENNVNSGAIKYIIMLSKARLFRARGKFDRALAELDKLEQFGVIRGIPKDIYFRSERALCYGGAGRFSEAVAEFLELLRIYPGHGVGYYQIGMIYQKAGQPGNARSSYEQFLEAWANADKGRPEVADARARLAGLE